MTIKAKLNKLVSNFILKINKNQECHDLSIITKYNRKKDTNFKLGWGKCYAQ